jgi:hypothetical protein
LEERMADAVPRTAVDPETTLVLSVRERLMFSAIFPEYGTLLEMRIIRSIEKKLELSPDEMKEIEYAGVLDDQGRPTTKVRWNEEKEKPLTVELSSPEIDFLKKVVKRLSGEGKIERSWADLAIKIDEAKKGE